MNVSKNQVLSFLAIICFILLMKNALVLKVVQPVGYVIDIYSMFPTSFYLGLVLCYLIGSLLLLNGRVLIGSLVLCMNHLQVLSIPYMLKYYSMGRADDMSYIGQYLKIANSGHIASWDIYPASHIIGAGISIISNIEPHLVSFIVPIVFSFMFIAGIYLYSKELFSNTNIRSLIIVSSFVLYLGTYNFLNVPNALFFAFIPLYLYIILSYYCLKKSDAISFSILFILVTLIIPFTHPFIVFYVFVLFLLLMIVNAFLIKRKNTFFNFSMPKLGLNAFLILFVAYLSWFFFQGSLIRNLNRSINNYLNQIGRDPVAQWATEKASGVGFEIIDYLQIMIYFYGRYVIPTLFIFISVLYIYYNRDVLRNKYFKITPFIVFLYISSLFSFLVLLINPVIIHQPDRILNLNFVVYAQIPLFALALHVLFFNKSKYVHNILLVCVILTSIWTISFFGAFDSPNLFRPNVALTYNEIEGMEWYFEYREEYPMIMPLQQANRFADIKGMNRREMSIAHGPRNFGYELLGLDQYNRVLDSEIDDFYKAYVGILTLDELLYDEIPNRSPTFRKEDFETFREDNSVDKIYDSLNIELYLIKPI
jgi:hypothetical protein